MKFSENWLRDWVNPDINTAALAEKLTMAGLEVEGIEPVAPAFTGVCVGEVLQVEPHPNADKLRVCQVNVGQETPLNIVCGAANIAAGLKVPVAQIGAKLPGDFSIKKSKLRGVASEGMICSISELGLAESSEGIWPLPSDAPVGKNVREYLGLDDVTIELNVTPNRSDCLGIEGLAREVGLLTQTNIQAIDYKEVTVSIPDTFPVQIDAPQACPHYVGRVIRGLNPQAQTPLWLQERLRRCGLRSISPIVDVTNYVLLELGQPLHAFDLKQLQGSVVVRMAGEGETLTLLNQQTLTLDAQSLVIADQQRILALAGVMGGLDSAVATETQDIFLESAFFAPEQLAGTARRYGLHTDSSYRFERGVDPNLQRRAAERATALLLDIAGGQAGELIECRFADYLPQKQVICLRAERITRLLGMALPAETVTDYLKRLHLTLISVTAQEWQVIPPSNRFDLNSEVDLIEELARVYGYNHLPTRPLYSHLNMSAVPARRVQDVQQILIQRGYQEAITYSFVDPKLLQLINPESVPLQLANPIASDMSAMRTTLWAGLLQAVQYNQKRQQPRVRLFETGLRFVTESGVLQQEPMLAGVATGSAWPEQWGLPHDPIDFYHVKADVEALLRADSKYKFKAATHPALHPGQTAAIYRDQHLVGLVGALHPQKLQELDLIAPVYLFELALSELLDAPLARFSEVSKYPSVRRDVALVLDQSIAVDMLIQFVRENGARETLQDCLLFDVYQGKGIEAGKKSVAIGLIFQAKSRNLTESEVDSSIDGILASLQQQFGAYLRK
ncbi:phenylalanine--tRNA ligase subunit beta [Thioflexithrix psekupsensis]|uniref:Phenylalanine--tRNA ligase beta subunit n=1 Tax=Thioflexithrix psekupsensis TaxID=1570016 RepID=A0A251X5E6_9GAMM|nr:phenylalanine--tRNA ligase subunit beta [Thioflexithrix psekupsensis]OUD12600.1 phenylalanine--tRNA ligase subunit beta [Thioflexithrix psekupsensis]